MNPLITKLCPTCKWGCVAPPYDETKFYCAKKVVIDKDSPLIGREKHLMRSIVDSHSKCGFYEGRPACLEQER